MSKPPKRKSPPVAASPASETPAEQKLRAAIARMSAKQLRAAFTKGQTLAALSLAQKHS